MSAYSEVCSAKTKAEMQEKFAELLRKCAKQFGGTIYSHAEMQRSNVGYFAGYYGDETRQRVAEWLGADHPIFGNSKSMTTEALAASLRAASRSKAA